MASLNTSPLSPSVLPEDGEYPPATQSYELTDEQRNDIEMQEANKSTTSSITNPSPHIIPSCIDTALQKFYAEKFKNLANADSDAMRYDLGYFVKQAERDGLSGWTRKNFPEIYQKYDDHCTKILKELEEEEMEEERLKEEKKRKHAEYQREKNCKEKKY